MMNAKLSRVLLLVISAGSLPLAAGASTDVATSLARARERTVPLKERLDQREVVPDSEIREVESEFIALLDRAPENPKTVDGLREFYQAFWGLDPAPALAAAVERSPDPAGLALRLTDQGVTTAQGKAEVVLGALAARPGEVTLWVRAADVVDEPVWESAFFEEASHRWQATAGLAEPGSFEVAAALAGKMLEVQMGSGLTRNALSAFKRLPPEMRERLTDGRVLILPADGLGIPFQIEIPDLRLDLAAAYFLEGDLKTAGELLRRIPEQEVKPQTERILAFFDGTEERQRRELARRVVARLLEPSTADPFDLLVHTLAQRVPLSLDGRLVLARKLALARLAERERYPAVATYVYEHTLRLLDPPAMPFAPGRGVPSRIRSVVEGLEAERVGLRQDLEARRTAVQDAARAGLGPDPASSLVPRLLRAPARAHFTEHPLPEGMTPIEVTPEREKALGRAAKALKVPDGFAVLRIERDSDRAAAICISQSYDPVGEIARGAYWIVLSSNGGATWSRPLYTGLRLNQPYVVRQASSLPLFAGEKLRIEVEIDEMDTTTITFPPIALAPKRTAKGLFLEIPLADLKRDTDSDGLTDLAEERLLTDPESPDTDGDGFSDAADPLPGVPWARDPSSAARALAAVIAEISGVEKWAIIEGRPGPRVLFRGGRRALKNDRTDFFVGDRALFAALDPNRRLVVLTAEEAAEAREKFGPFFPIKLELFLLDRSGRRGYVVWSASWQGGDFSLEEKNGQWIVEQVGFWIT